MENHDAVTVFATFVPKAGMEQAVLDVLERTLTPTRSEEGCRRFDLFVSTGSPTTFHLYEIFDSAAAIDVHRSTSHYATYRAAIEPLLEVPPKAVRATAIDVQG